MRRRAFFSSFWLVICSWLTPRAFRLAVVEGASEVVEQAKSSVSKLAELRERSQQSSKKLKELLAAL